MDALAAAHDAAVQMLDTSMVRVHQHAFADSASQSVGRSRGGLTSKLHVVIDANGLPVRLGITPGEAYDNRLCSALLTGLKSRTMVLADRGYDRWIREFVNESGAWANILRSAIAKTPSASARTYIVRATAIPSTQLITPALPGTDLRDCESKWSARLCVLSVPLSLRLESRPGPRTAPQLTVLWGFLFRGRSLHLLALLGAHVA